MRKAAVSAALLLLSAPAWAGVVMGMRQEIRSERGNKSYDGTMYVVPLAARFDLEPAYEAEEGAPPPGRMSFIIRLDERKIWFVLPGAQNYYELDFATLRKYQEAGTFNWKNGNPFRTGSDVKYLKVKGRRRIMKTFAQKYQVVRQGKEGYDLAWIRETPRSKTLDRYAANQAKVFAEEEIDIRAEPPPGVILAGRAYMENRDRVDWRATSFRNAKLAADTFEPPEGAQPVPFAPDVAELWMQGMEHFKTAFKEAVKAEVKRQATEAAKEQGKKAMKKAFKGLFR